MKNNFCLFGGNQKDNIKNKIEKFVNEYVDFNKVADYSEERLVQSILNSYYRMISNPNNEDLDRLIINLRDKKSLVSGYLLITREDKVYKLAFYDFVHRNEIVLG